MAGSFSMLVAQSDESEAGLGGMSLEDLMKQRSELHSDSDTASGVKETLLEAPGAMVVFDSQDMERRGIEDLEDLLRGLPGFDTIVTNGTMQTVAYQRGYRTPWTQRTLVLINGKVDNNLWNHAAQISRQYPINMVERVEVLYGPAGAVYGPNAFLGVINVVTRDSSNLAEDKVYAEASVSSGSFDTRSVDIAFGGRKGDFSFDLGLRFFESDEAGIEDYSGWGFTDPALLSDLQHWGQGIGEGIDPVSGARSPIGDLDVDGTVERGELFEGNPLGKYADPTDNFGVIAEARWKGWELGYIRWTTEEGYGPYYSFADGQAVVPWEHESEQLYLQNDTFLDSGLEVGTELVYRTSGVGGEWAESFGGFVSLSGWNSWNKAWRIEQDYRMDFGNGFSLNGGLKFEEKDLTKVYLMNGYYDGGGVSVKEGPTSSTGFSSDGSGIREASEISSENPSVRGTDPLLDGLPDFNVSQTDDIGAYLQGIWTEGKWRLNGSIRYDHNSEYRSVVNPRGAIIYHQDAQTTFKIAYGEAFQEASPKDLYGGWNGRLSNPNLTPEKAKNLEFIVVRQGEIFMHDASLFFANYEDAIAGGQNVGGRDVSGFEYRGSFRLGNPISHSADVTGTLYYTYTDSQANRQYNNGTGEWDVRTAETGDIAPHKVNASLNIPIGSRWNANVSAHWYSARSLFSENPLRADSNPNRVLNRKAEAYFNFDANLKYETDRYRVSLKVENLFEEDYLVPGLEGASSGDDFTGDFDGFQNSLLPQVNVQTFRLTLTWKH